MLRIRICFVANIGRQKENVVRAQELITDNRGGLLSRYRTSLLAYIAHKHTAMKYSVGSKVGTPCVGQGNVRQLVAPTYLRTVPARVEHGIKNHARSQETARSSRAGHAPGNFGSLLSESVCLCSHLHLSGVPTGAWSTNFRCSEAHPVLRDRECHLEVSRFQ
jgi:hypothetical protein